MVLSNSKCFRIPGEQEGYSWRP
ncbi:unnamed protein product, partial [Allacma fusca]